MFEHVLNKKNNSIDYSGVPFGTLFTPHMFVMEWNTELGWHNQRIQDYQPFSCDPASLHMHYGQAIFEGMKAFRTNDNCVVLFRPQENFTRMNESARIMCMPELDEREVLIWLKKLVALDSDWVSSQPGTSLYIRPTMIATEATLNLKPAEHYTFYIIMSPVGSFYKNGFTPASIFVSEKYTRASSGGVGRAKTGGNYAAAMRAQIEAKEQGCAQVLWLDPIERKYVEEVGSMNIFFVIDNEVVTPVLNDSILPGVTRKSIFELGSQSNFVMVQRRISIDEVIQALQEQRLKEVFGTGTAVSVAPVGKIVYAGKSYTINDNCVGPVTQRLYK